jgi:tetratricopeptide (TPR) repeat protein
MALPGSAGGGSTGPSLLRRRWLAGLLTLGAAGLFAAAQTAAPGWTEEAAARLDQGLLHLASNRLATAVEAFTAAAQAGPADAFEPRYDLALSLFRARRYQEALGWLERLPPLPRALVLKARTLRSLGQAEESFAAWEAARRTGELDAATLWHLARLLSTAERPGEVLTVAADLLARGAPADVVAVERADALAALGRVQEAAAAYRQALAGLAAGDAEASEQLRLAEAAAAAGDGTEASRLLRMGCNVLRVEAAYRRLAEPLAKRDSRSPLSDEPLPLPAASPPGPSPAPLAFTAEVPAAGRSLCPVEGGLLVVGDEGGTVLSRKADGSWAAARTLGEPATACLSLDLDQDREDDLVLVGASGLRVLWSHGASLSLPGAATGATAIDYDRDGDADLLSVGPEGARLWRNNRDRTFTDVTRESGLARAAPGPVTGAIAADLTGDGAADLYLIRSGAPNLLLTGLDRGDVQVVGGAAGTGDASGPAVVADWDGDGYLDVITDGRLFRNRGLGKLVPEPLPAAAGALRLGAADLDLDGILDLLVLDGGQHLKLLRGIGGGAFAPWPGEAPGAVDSLAAGDFEGDGSLDLALLSKGRLRFARSRSSGRSIGLSLRATKDNTSAVGARVELWAGLLHARREIRLGTHELGEQGPHLQLGLGQRSGAQWLRVVWPNGTWSSEEEPHAAALSLEQPQDLVGSCPFLYAWNGSRFAFVTDLLGGAPLGLPLGGGAYMPIDSDEHVLLAAAQLRPRAGRYEIRITQELRELLYLDHAALLAADHPAGTRVASDDALHPPPFAASRFFVAARAEPPLAAVDDHGVDVRDRVTRTDGRYADGFRWIRYQGYAEPHSLTLDFAAPAASEKAFLLVTGGYFWSEADNYGLAQSSTVRPMPPRLEVWKDGRWETVLDPMPFPGGRVKTLAVDLAGRLRPGRVRLRISTNLRLYFDSILLAQAGGGPRLRPMALRKAVLSPHGYSAPGPFDGRLPRPYEYARTVPGRPFPRFEGFFTRYGDVRPLLARADDALVILHHGDQVELSFAAPPPPPPGWVRDFFLYTVGWDKDGDPKTAYGTTVEPLPFRAMSGYPYAGGYPSTPALDELFRRYQTRWISSE